MRNALILTAGLLLVGPVSTAPAASAQEPAMVIAYLDKTGDGKVDLNEYKRKQAAPGLKITPLAFGVGRRIPIVQKYVS